jgi:hypothetical protein
VCRSQCAPDGFALGLDALLLANLVSVKLQLPVGFLEVGHANAAAVSLLQHAVQAAGLGAGWSGAPTGLLRFWSLVTAGLNVVPPGLFLLGRRRCPSRL